jgi:hypothetical protein
MVVQAQDAELLGYVRDDIQRISQQSLPTWTPRWTGPIEAATVLAWEAEHGYGRFVRDFNGDGVVDEGDTIQLADDLGRMSMATETQRGTTDVRLVLGLAQYVAGLYPDEFVLKIYDVGFPGELLAEGLGTYSPTMVPGITIEVKPANPSVAAYELEMESAEGVILGVYAAEGENNEYLTGRSFLFEATPEGYTPIDLAWPEEDRWQPGTQGQVLQTLGRMDDRMSIDYRGRWKEVEFMLALSPLHEPVVGGEPRPCPADAVAYDVTETPTLYGRIQIAECVTRSQSPGYMVFDKYTYTVTNLDFLYGSCGFCLFFIPNTLGLPTVHMSGPAFWMQHAGWGGWWWMAPIGSCGILPGNSAVFSFTVVGPTADTWVTGSVSGCAAGMPPTIAPTKPRLLSVRTTGPGKEDVPDDDHPGDCPDLAIKIQSATCTRVDRGFEVEIEVIVGNIGGVASDTTTLRFESTSGGDTAMIGALDPAETETESFTLSFTLNQIPPCPIEFTLEVDPYDWVTECNEDNNEVAGSVYCPNCK